MSKAFYYLAVPHWLLFALIWTKFDSLALFGFRHSGIDGSVSDIKGSVFIKYFHDIHHLLLQASRRFYSNNILLREVEISTRSSNLEHLSELLNSRVLSLPSKDANVIISKVLNNLSKPGLWTISRDFLKLILHNSSKSFNPDVLTLSSAMTLCIRYYNNVNVLPHYLFITGIYLLGTSDMMKRYKFIIQ